MLVITVGHMVTIPTAMAISEIATNQRVEGGGEYYIISRSFGIIIGAAIGVALFLARAVSVAFYLIAFAAAFSPLIAWLQQRYALPFSDLRFVSLPALGALTYIILRKGADLGMKVLYIVAGTLVLSLAMFFLGEPEIATNRGLHRAHSNRRQPGAAVPRLRDRLSRVYRHDGRRRPLRRPQVSEPVDPARHDGATLGGMVVYILVAYKLAVSADPDALATDELVMSRIALWGPIIPIGLAAASISSAIGSFLVAPRTLQAIAGDKVFPWPRMNTWLAVERGGVGRARQRRPGHGRRLPPCLRSWATSTSSRRSSRCSS